jgi:4-amino-4-deoxy-L-arabinose transferase-like glycosyltransferase
MAPRRLVWWIIAIGAAARVALATTTGLGVDESYAVASSRQLSLSYFDHPPLSFWLAHASALLFGTESHLAVRLPFIVLFAATTWLIYGQTARAFGEREGWLAALFLNVAPVFSISTAYWVLPDGPLMCSLAGAGYCLVRVLLDPAGDRHATRWWLGAGASTGIAMLSKYQALLFLGGVLLFLVARPTQRRWLRRPEPYAALAVALLLFTPVLVWNADHGWVSFLFQLGRGASRPSATIGQRLGALGQTVGGQALWLLPWLWIPLVWVMVEAFVRRPPEDRRWFFGCLAVVPIALFTLVALGGRPGLPHWPASGYLFLFPLLASAIVGRADRVIERRVGAAMPAGGRGTRRHSVDRRLRPVLAWSAWCVGSFVLLTAVATTAEISGWPVRLVLHPDPTLEGTDWRDLAPGLDSLGVLPRPHRFVAATSWVQAGKVAYALGPKVPVLALSVDPRHFAFLHDERAFLGQDAVIVDRLPARHDLYARYGPYFGTITPVGQVTIRRLGRPVFDVGVYLGHDFQRPFPTVGMRVRALAAVPSGEPADYLPPDPTQDWTLVERAP